MAMNVLSLLFHTSYGEDSESFATAVLALESGCCFVLSRLWEIHAEKSLEDLEQVKHSSSSFYKHCGLQQDKVLAFIQCEVETFRSKVGHYLLMKGLALS